MTDPKHSKAEEVFNQLKGLPTSGIIAQKSTGLVYLDIDDDFILKGLEVLQTDSYIILPPYSNPDRQYDFGHGSSPSFCNVVIAEDYEMKDEGREF